MPLADGTTYLARHPRLLRRDALRVLRHEVSADGEYPTLGLP